MRLGGEHGSQCDGSEPVSRIGAGKTWPAPANATRTQHLQVYRYAPDSGARPRIDTYTIDRDDCGDCGDCDDCDDCGPMLLDALIKIMA